MDTMASSNHSTSEDSDIILSLPNSIVVRRYRAADATSLSNHGNNIKIWNQLRNRMPYPYTKDAAQFWIEYCSSPEQFRASGPWTPDTGAQGPFVPTNFTIAVNGQACGSIGLDFGDPVDVYFRSAEVGYWLGEDYWGKGVMGAVVPAFVDWTWQMFGILIRLNAEVASQNLGSFRCLQRAGFVEEGRKKCAFVKNGVILDEILLGMLRPGTMEMEVDS